VKQVHRQTNNSLQEKTCGEKKPAMGLSSQNNSVDQIDKMKQYKTT